MGRVVVSSLTAVALIGPTAGCYSFRPNSTPTAGQSGRIRLVENAPVTIVRGKAGSDSLLLRSINELEGALVRVTPDSLTVKVERTRPFARQAANQLVLIPRTSTTDFAERKLDEGRTMVAVLGISLLMIFVIAAATWELDFGEGTTISY